MPTLRDRVREALSAHELSDREARSELDVILERSRGAPRRRPWLVALPVVATAVLAVAFFAWHRSPLPAPATATGGILIYVHISGEPEARALALHLEARGVN